MTGSCVFMGMFPQGVDRFSKLHAKSKYDTNKAINSCIISTIHQRPPYEAAGFPTLEDHRLSTHVVFILLVCHGTTLLGLFSLRVPTLGTTISLFGSRRCITPRSGFTWYTIYRTASVLSFPRSMTLRGSRALNGVIGNLLNGLLRLHHLWLHRLGCVLWVLCRRNKSRIHRWMPIWCRVRRKRGQKVWHDRRGTVCRDGPFLTRDLMRRMG